MSCLRVLEEYAFRVHLSLYESDDPISPQVCQTCRRVFALLHLHARECRAERCPVLHCRAFRERICQMQRQQTQVLTCTKCPSSPAHLLSVFVQMDMRRRAAMNSMRRQALECD